MQQAIRRLIDQHWDTVEPYSRWEASFARLALSELDRDVDHLIAETDPERRDIASHELARLLIRAVLAERAAGRPVRRPSDESALR